MKHFIAITIMLSIAFCASCEKKNNNGDDDDNKPPVGNPVTVKYVIGNYYNVNGVQGIVYKLNADSTKGMIVSLDESNVKWAKDTAIEGIKTEATDSDDGMLNMNKIKALGIDNYPAFKWCEQKNTNGVTGWYLPASHELYDILVVYNNSAVFINDSLTQNEGTTLNAVEYWSSTELPQTPPRQVINISFQSGGEIYTHKNDIRTVRAVRAF
jgi:hypothetical protein